MDGVLNRRQQTSSERSSNVCKVFAPQCFWHLYHRPHGLNFLGQRGRRCLALRYHFKKKTVNLVALYSRHKGTYTRANTNVAAIANVMKQVDFIFARSV
jgi:hypothetical protein